MSAARHGPVFALAKIQPPRQRAGLIERPRLQRALGAALRERRLSLLLAPAGYGKTAALTQATRPWPADAALAWISADEDDQLPRFLACLAAALEPLDLPWRVAPDALATLAEGEHGLRDAAAAIANALGASEVPRGLIAIDDAHRIADPRVWQLLQSLTERLDDAWGLAIASRVEPPLGLARLRAAGELAEFRQAELRFDADEIEAMLGAGGHGTSAGRSRELLARTGGWAAGLRLSLSASPERGAPEGTDRTQRHLFDYLADEVLRDMPAELRDFLLRCAVLPELTAARCAHVTGQPNAARLLDEIERRGLFVTVLEADEPTMRLHDLFRDFLEDRLQRDHAAELPALLRRAAEHEPDLSRAIGLLARAGAWDEATALLAARAQEQLSVGAGGELEQMLASFPPAELERRPDLQLVRGLIAWPRYDWDTLSVSMQRAADGYAREGRARDAALTRTNLCSGLLHAGRLDDAGRELEALRALPLDDAVRAFVCYSSAWEAFAAARSEAVAPHFSAMLEALERLPIAALWQQFPLHTVFAGLPGMAPLLRRFADDAERIAGEAPSPLRAGVMHLRCWLALSQGRLTEAGDWLAQADEDCRWLGSPRNVATDNRMTHALLRPLLGDIAGGRAAAAELVDDMRRHSTASHRRVHLSEVLFVQARTAWIAQDAAGLREIDRALAAAADPAEWRASPMLRAMSRAFVALADDRLDDADRLLTPIAADIDRTLFFAGAQARVMLAAVHARRGAADAAAAALAPWLDAAQAAGELGGGLLAGPAMVSELAAMPWGSRLTAAQTALLQRLHALLEPARGPDRAAPAAPQARAVPLTEREIEVLARIAAGDSNKLIARAFDLSPHTVKRHVANILDKLGLASRGQAAAWYRDAR